MPSRKLDLLTYPAAVFAEVMASTLKRKFAWPGKRAIQIFCPGKINNNSSAGPRPFCSPSSFHSCAVSLFFRAELSKQRGKVGSIKRAQEADQAAGVYLPNAPTIGAPGLGHFSWIGQFERQHDDLDFWYFVPPRAPVPKTKRPSSSLQQKSSSVATLFESSAPPLDVLILS